MTTLCLARRGPLHGCLFVLLMESLEPVTTTTQNQNTMSDPNEQEDADLPIEESEDETQTEETAPTREDDSSEDE